MKQLARAVVDAIAFLELSDEDAIDPDIAVDAMEMLTATLRDCSKKELTALRAAAKEALSEQRKSKADDEVLEFYENFMTDLEES